MANQRGEGAGSSRRQPQGGRGTESARRGAARSAGAGSSSKRN